MINPLIEFLQRFRVIPEEDQELISLYFEPKIIPEGRILLEAGRTAREFFFICKGIMRIVAQNEKGNQVTHFFIKENQFCTILNSFHNQLPSDERIQTVTETSLRVIERGRLLELYSKIPYLKILIDQITQQALLDKIKIRNSYLGQDSKSRYELFVNHQPEIALHVPLSDIASYLDMTPQSLSRIRKQVRSTKQVR